MPVNIQVHVAIAVIHIFLLSHSYLFIFFIAKFFQFGANTPVGKKSEQKKHLSFLRFIMQHLIIYFNNQQPISFNAAVEGLHTILVIISHHFACFIQTVVCHCNEWHFLLSCRLRHIKCLGYPYLPVCAKNF